jgi:hypothetical protein
MTLNQKRIREHKNMSEQTNKTQLPLLRALVIEQYKGYTNSYPTARRMANAIKKVMAEIDEIENSSDFESDLIITVEWTKSCTWGVNPRAFTNYGFDSGSVSGCGYDKLSTATARALNSDKRILKLMYFAKEKELSQRKATYKEQNGHEENSERAINQFLFGYGSGYNALPNFEGGVGINCHERICARLGLVMESVTDTKHVNVYRIFKAKQEE